MPLTKLPYLTCWQDLKNGLKKHKIQQYRHIAFRTDNNRNCLRGIVKSDDYDLLLPWFVTHWVTEVRYP